MSKQVIYKDISDERARQDTKWGGRKHDDKHSKHEWLGYIREHTYKAEKEGIYGKGDGEAYRKRLVEVAALAVAAIESYDRGNRGT